MTTVDLEETRTCVAYKAFVEIRKILDEARKACVLDLVFEFDPLLKEVVYMIGDHYDVPFVSLADLEEAGPDLMRNHTD